jgi:hypothetical protein
MLATMTHRDETAAPSQAGQQADREAMAQYPRSSSPPKPLGQQLFHPLAVPLEAADHLPINHQCGRRTAFPLIHQLIVGTRVCLDVLPLKGDALLPKELLGRPAVPSTGLMVQNHLLHDRFLLFSRTQVALYQ